ncbi:hypothetical protein VIGAN_10085800, partial [Vigna angularis var. angularis]
LDILFPSLYPAVQAGITEVGLILVEALLHAYQMEVEQMHFCLLWLNLLYHTPGTSSLIVKHQCFQLLHFMAYVKISPL